MSVLSTLALLMLPGALKAKPDREAELAGEIIGLKVDLADAKRECDQAISERDALRHELERAWARHGEHPLQQIPAGPDFRPPALAQQQQAQGLLAQQGHLSPYNQMQDNAQMAQQHQLAMQHNLQNAQAYGQGMMLGSQALDPELWCNCVPSRSQVWAANGAEA